MARDELHPQRRALDERRGRHVKPRASAKQKGEHRANQPHVMILPQEEPRSGREGVGILADSIGQGIGKHQDRRQHVHVGATDSARSIHRFGKSHDVHTRHGEVVGSNNDVFITTSM